MSTTFPKVTGPITGGKGRPSMSYLGNLEKLGYIEEEYFLEGTAAHYDSQGGLSPDGKWKMNKEGDTPYKTRILVHRPADSKKFNGVVLVEWLNVTQGYETSHGHTLEVYHDGYVLVYVTAQGIGISSPSDGMIALDPERYQSLCIVDDWISYDIFTQAARAVGPDRDTSATDPLDGLEVKYLIATGYSQSALRMMAYANGVQPIEGVFDGIMPIVGGNLFSALNNEGHQEMLKRSMQRMAPDASEEEKTAIFRGTYIRDDLKIPVFCIDSEYESKARHFNAQPDSDKYRVWQVAGASHVSRDNLYQMKYTAMRDGHNFSNDLNQCVEVSYTPVQDRAIGHLVQWIANGVQPPIFPRITTDESGKVLRDNLGNALGGIRLPELEIPTAAYYAEMGFVPGEMPTGWRYGGYQFNFPVEKLTQLYPTHKDYVDKVTAAAEKACEQEAISREQVDEYIRKASAMPVPLPEITYA